METKKILIFFELAWSLFLFPSLPSSPPRPLLNSRFLGWVDFLKHWWGILARCIEEDCLTFSLKSYKNSIHRRFRTPLAFIICWWIQNLGIDSFVLQSQLLLWLSILLPSQVFGFGRLLMGGTHRHKGMILWAFFWAHVQFKKIPFDPLRSQQPTLINITQKLAVLRAFLRAWLLKCQAAANSVSLLQLEAEEMRRFKKKNGKSDH